MKGITKLKVNNSFFNITEQNKKFEFFTDTFDKVSFEVLKDELEEIVSISDNTPYHLQHKNKDRVLLKHIRI